MADAIESKGRPDEGYVFSKPATLVVPDSELQTGLTAFGRAYAYFVIICENANGISLATNMTLAVQYPGVPVECNLYDMNDPSTIWSKGALATAGTWAFLLHIGAFANHLRIKFSKAPTADVPFKVIGFDGAKS